MNQEDLHKIQKQLEQKKEESKKTIEELRITDPFNLDITKDSNPELSSPDNQAQQTEAHDRVDSQINALLQTIAKIDLTLVRIKNGGYGTCEVCGKEIPSSRLVIMPLTSMCLEDEKKMEKSAKRINV